MRPLNPFSDEVLSLFFIILSFGFRDDLRQNNRGLILIDRDSLREVLRDIWAQRKLGNISGSQERLLVRACEEVVLNSRNMDYSLV